MCIRDRDWFRAGTGLGDTNKPRVAIAEFGPRADSAKAHASLFSQVVRDDLQFSGIIDVVSASMNPATSPTPVSYTHLPDVVQYHASDDARQERRQGHREPPAERGADNGKAPRSEPGD